MEIESYIILGGTINLLHTDRQTNSLTPYTGVCGYFLIIKFDTSLHALLAGGLGDTFTS